MAYIANKTRVSALTVGGVDLTSSFLSWTCSDSSAYKNGCIVTTGQLILGQIAGGTEIAAYDHNSYRRGTVVTLDVTLPSGSTVRHPRGYLYVLSSSYSVEDDTLEIELGCRLALIALTDELDQLVALSPMHLDVTQQQFSNVSGAFASLGQYLYQDNQGNLVSGEFFDGDDTTGTAAGEWLSIAGTTALAVKPLTGTEAIPDRINLQYLVPKGSLADDRRGYVETTTETSNYFTQFPATILQRTKDDEKETIEEEIADMAGQTEVNQIQIEPNDLSNCGNTPPKPSGPGNDDQDQPEEEKPAVSDCDPQYSTSQTSIYVPAIRVEVTETYYDGPAGQVSVSKSSSTGPALEANSQYYADKYAYCKAVWANQCKPDGGCPLEGTSNILLGYTETTNFYGSASELIRTVQDTWVTTLSAAQPRDWRSGVVNGIPQDFNQNLSTSKLYRASRVQSEYSQDSYGANVQETTTWTSVASRGVGINSGSLDALDGIVTTTKRVSATTAPLEISPDRINSPSTETVDKQTELVIFTGRFTEVPPEAGPYIMDDQIPMPLLGVNVASALATYSNYITRFIKGDALGIQIGEALREDIVTNWKPGMPFRYHDPVNDHLVALRMDASVWGVDQNGAALVTNGIWIGDSDGTVTVPSNVTGDSRPDMGSGGGPGSTPVLPSVNGETAVNGGAFAWTVDVDMSLGNYVEVPGNDGVIPPLPSDLSYLSNYGAMCMCAGLIVATGDVLEVGINGSIPASYNGSLVVTGGTVVNTDLFAAAP